MGRITERAPSTARPFELSLADMSALIAALQETRVAADEYTKFVPTLRVANKMGVFRVAFTALPGTHKSRTRLETPPRSGTEVLQKSPVGWVEGRISRKSLADEWDPQLEPWVTLDLAGAARADATLLLTPIQRYIGQLFVEEYTNPDNYDPSFVVSLDPEGTPRNQPWFNSDWSPNADADIVGCVLVHAMALLSRWGNQYGFSDLQLVVPQLVGYGLMLHPAFRNLIAATRDRTMADFDLISKAFGGIEVVSYAGGDYSEVKTSPTGDVIIPTSDFSFDLGRSVILKFKPSVDENAITLSTGEKVGRINNPDLMCNVVPAGAEYDVAFYEDPLNHKIGVVVNKLYGYLKNESNNVFGVLIQNVVASE